MPQSLSVEISGDSSSTLAMDSKVCRLSSDWGKAVKLGRALNRLSTRNRSSTSTRAASKVSAEECATWPSRATKCGRNFAELATSNILG